MQADHIIANGATVRAKGEWVNTFVENAKRCVVCGKWVTKVHLDREPVFDYVYCPYCGADMRGDSE
jgi:hypothetical protein